MTYERRSSVSRELRYWEAQRMGRTDKLAFVAMCVILVGGLFAVWSV